MSESESYHTAKEFFRSINTLKEQLLNGMITPCEALKISAAELKDSVLKMRESEYKVIERCTVELNILSKVK